MSNHLCLPSRDWPIFWIRNFIYLCWPIRRWKTGMIRLVRANPAIWKNQLFVCRDHLLWQYKQEGNWFIRNWLYGPDQNHSLSGLRGTRLVEARIKKRFWTGDIQSISDKTVTLPVYTAYIICCTWYRAWCTITGKDVMQSQLYSDNIQIDNRRQLIRQSVIHIWYVVIRCYNQPNPSLLDYYLPNQPGSVQKVPKYSNRQQYRC